jgi:hypothetical protein
LLSNATPCRYTAAPVYHEMPHDAGVVEGCTKYQWQPRVNTSHHVEGRGTRSQKSLGCNKLRKYRDYLDLGVVAVVGLYKLNAGS